MKSYVLDILSRHYDEAAGGLVNKAPSDLNRGEGTEVANYLFKIDLVGSTMALRGRHKTTYLKVAHSFLSTIDQITRDHGADEQQVEYAGDSVLAYFPTTRVDPRELITVATLGRYALEQLKRLDATLRQLPLSSRVAIHCGTLIMSSIGPWGGRLNTAMGLPLHELGHMEKDIPAGEARTTREFWECLEADFRKKYLYAKTKETQVLVTPAPTLMPTPALPDPYRGGLLGSVAAQSGAQSLANILYGASQAPQPIVTPPRYETKVEILGYHLKWPLLYRELNLS